MSTTLVCNLCRKLGLSEPKLQGKSEELLRLMDIRKIGLSLNYTSKVVIALDLASSVIKIPFDRSRAIVLSGLTKRKYLTNLQIVDDMLNLSNPTSIKEICVQLDCINVINLAEDVLKAYKSSQSFMNSSECDKPMFLIAAVQVACKHTKTKVQHSKLIELARIKRSVFENLVSVMTKLVAEMNVSKEYKKRDKTLIEVVEEKLEKDKSLPRKKLRVNENNDDDDAKIDKVKDYEKWKERILKNALASSQL